MNHIIKAALSALQGANYADYFKQMDKVVPTSLMTLYEEHKGKFTAGQYPWNFYQQLETFSIAVNDFLSKQNESMNDLFKKRLNEADKTAIPALLQILQNYYEQIPDNLRGSFSSLKKEFINQPNLNVEDWKAKLLVWVGQLRFEIIVSEQPTLITESKISNLKSMDFRSYYLNSLEILAKLDTNVTKSSLRTDKEHYNETLNLYFQYESIFNEYANYVQQELKEELEFNKYKIQSFVETSINFQTEIKKINQKIVELRNYLFDLNNPDNEDGLYKALETLLNLKEEAKYLKLFREFISLLNSNNPTAYDYFNQLNLDLLLKEIQSSELRANIKEFWNYVQEKYTQHLSGMGKKKAFVDSFLTGEVKKQLTTIFNFLFN